MPYQSLQAVKIKDEEEGQIMLGLQSISGNGKTWSACTFPNPVILDFDNNTVGLKGRHPNYECIQKIPFYDPAFVAKWATSTFPLGNPNHRPNQKDALVKWLLAEGPKVPSDSTVILDSWTAAQDAFDIQTDLTPAITKTGEVDSFAFWAQKQDWSRDVLRLLKGLKCHVVVTFHEQYDYDKNGILINRIRPFMQGKFVGKLPNYFTDFFRCIVSEVKGADNKPKLLSDGKTKVVEYLWQIKSDELISLKTRMKVEGMFVPADFKSFAYKSISQPLVVAQT